MATYYLKVEVLIGTRFKNFHIDFICCISRRVKFTKGKILLLGSAPIEPVEKQLESMEYKHSWPTTDSPAEKTEFYVAIMRYKVALRTSVYTSSHPSYTGPGQGGEYIRRYDATIRDYGNFV